LIAAERTQFRQVPSLVCPSLRTTVSTRIRVGPWMCPQPACQHPKEPHASQHEKIKPLGKFAACRGVQVSLEV
jgi:hypothetical protein